MNQIDINMLNRIYQASCIGMQSTDKVLKKLKDGELKRLIKKQYESYEKINLKCETMATKEHVDLKENSFITKVKQTTMIYFSLWMNKTPRHIVEIMLNGTNMGIVDIIKAQADLADAEENLLLLAAEFRKSQEEFYEKLKKQLQKV